MLQTQLGNKADPEEERSEGSGMMQSFQAARQSTPMTHKHPPLGAEALKGALSLGLTLMRP